MATLVLSTVGTALGGPVGSAIGALIGQSIDQELLAPARRGPRVGDLSVQTSSYGTPMPRIYGRMRVAGTVVWSTDLTESRRTDGAKGQPDVTYSYSVSLAVALSSRTATSIGRIWADGKLLRGAAGDFKVDTQFRFLGGDEDQVIDPLIASVEGIENTPAYRGVALAVFENLQLANFGNRIPILTFEVIADDAPRSIGSILADASGGAIWSDAEDQIAGFAAYGSSIKSAVEPLVDCFAVNLFDDGVVLRPPSNLAALPVGLDDLGNSADGKQATRYQREQTAARSVPAAVRLTYYDPARDYQTGEARAVAGEQPGNLIQQDLPAVLDASEAKSIAQQMIARAWSGRDHLTLRLPPSSLALEPGRELELDLSPAQWRVEKATVNGFVVVAEARPSSVRASTLAGDGGRIVQNSDVVAEPLSVALLDIPNVLGLVSNDPTVLLAATSSKGWQRRAVEVRSGGQAVSVEVARWKSILGRAESVLAPAAAELIDDENSVEVSLTDAEQWLTSCDDDALAAGENLAVLGNELIQFGRVTPLGGGRFRLGHLLRGRGGSEWACAGHFAGDPFCLLTAGTLQPISLPSWSIGATLSATPGATPSTSIEFLAEGVRPLAPVNLSADRQTNGDLVLNWTRRSRQGFAWLDEIDSPLGEAREQYRVNIIGTVDTAELTTSEPSLIVSATDVAALGPGAGSVEVRQIGDVAASRPARLTFIFS